jgi:hypothetical protein
MPLIPLVAVLLLVLALILAMPLLLVLRYRAGTVRRLGRRWMATLNLVRAARGKKQKQATTL